MIRHGEKRERERERERERAHRFSCYVEPYFVDHFCSVLACCGG